MGKVWCLLERDPVVSKSSWEHLLGVGKCLECTSWVSVRVVLVCVIRLEAREREREKELVFSIAGEPIR